MTPRLHKHSALYLQLTVLARYAWTCIICCGWWFVHAEGRNNGGGGGTFDMPSLLSLRPSMIALLALVELVCAEIQTLRFCSSELFVQGSFLQQSKLAALCRC